MTWQNLLSGKRAIVKDASRGLGRADAFRLTGASSSADVIVTDFLIESSEASEQIEASGELNYSPFKKVKGEIRWLML